MNINKIPYTDLINRQEVLNQNSNLFLIAEQNITEGNFLIFSDEPLPSTIIYTTVPQEEFIDMSNRLTQTEQENAAMLLALVEGGLL